MLRFISEDGNGLFQRIEVAETGEDITKTLAVDYGAQITMGQMVTAKLELSTFPLRVVAGQSIWGTKHPVTGDYTPIRAIEFTDGTRIAFADDGTPTVTSASQPILDVRNPKIGKTDGADGASPD